jgi:hypothetical protein
MAFANKLRIGSRTVGWNVFFSHAEAHAISLSQLTIPSLLAGVTGPKVPPLLMALPKKSWGVTCLAGGHDGVKAVVSFYPPAALLIPR